jgi:hypothetical protein
LDAKSNEYSTFESKIIQLNEEMTKLQEDHRIKITQLTQSLNETEDMKCSLERINDGLKIELEQISKQNVCIHSISHLS